MTGSRQLATVRRILVGPAWIFCFMVCSLGAYAGDIKNGLILHIAYPGDTVIPQDTLTVVHQGSPAFPGEVGAAATDIPYAIGWDGLPPKFMMWNDNNGVRTLYMDHIGLDVDNAWGALDYPNAEVIGDIDLSADTWAGSRIRSNHPGLGAKSFVDTIFTNGDKKFTISGCVTIGSPELRAQWPTASLSTAEHGEPFIVTATVNNFGVGTCEGSTLHFYLSTNSTIDTSDTVVASRSVSPLSANATALFQATINAPSSDGRYYVGACVGSVTGETILWDQCSEAVKIWVGPVCDKISVAGQDLGTMQAIQACRKMIVGPALTVSSDLGVSLYSGETVEFLNGVSVATDAQLSVASCGHDICTPKPRWTPMNPCMPCVSTICETWPYCCDFWWDSFCVENIALICQLTCP